MGDSDVKTKDIKLVVVGDGAIGKTSLLVSYARNHFPESHDPTVFDCITTSLQRHNIKIKLNLWDTAGQEDYDRLRPLAYHHADVFLLCFALNSNASLYNAKAKWAPELNKHSNAPVLLIGLKADLRKDSNSISKREGSDIARSIKTVKYLECSSLKREGVTTVFESAVDAVILPKKAGCVIL
ncbi:RAC1 [Lepeophtheirus salmonis]|uniref:RAC1 n=1 Tax=Lepeophtheirus salmonis TaxID=72036 RepID=A0A7R8HBA2_LEPSM|nr:ras-related protein ced-10-like [Lepeophtheirus salmonis]CAB4067101.1 RAC1 [Lepeophtheirus salmonis]CAF2981999.1 RAC1 [Lepeophtheirus salmonis]